jgi:predicted Zn-dependent protease
MHMRRVALVPALLLATACATTSPGKPPASAAQVPAPASAPALAQGRAAATSPGERRQGGSQWDATRSLALELTRRAPENPDGWLFLGMVHMKDGQVQEAITALERSVLLQDRPQARYSLGVALAASGRVDQAVPHLERSVALDPNFYSGWVALGRFRAMLGRFDAAAIAVREAWRLQPETLDVDELTLTVSRGLVARGNHEEAITLMRELISRRGERPDSLETLAQACDAKGDRACAVEAYRKLLATGAALPSETKAHAQQRLGALAP